MRNIDIDATRWICISDLYDSILAAIKAPEWHGRSIGALMDSMIWGNINEVEAPYTIRIFNLSSEASEIRDEIASISAEIKFQREYHIQHKGSDVEAQIEIVGS